MRITFVIPTPNLGGGTRVVTIHAQALVRMGHTVQIVSIPPQTTPLLERLNFWTPASRRMPPSPSHLDGSGLDHYVLDRRRPVTDADVPDSDIVIATWWETAEWVNSLSPSKGAKVYFIQHHEIFPYLPVERCQATYRMPFHKIVVARWLQDVMNAQYGDGFVDLVPNSVDKTQFFAPHRTKQLVPTVGLLYSATPSKGLDLALAALRLTSESFPNLRIIAFGSERPNNRLSLPQSSEFYFCPPQAQIRDVYAQCDGWITASRSEGFNLPAMEAMACRTPVVSTRTGWPEEAVKTRLNGVLVEVNDLTGLAKGVQWVLSLSNEDWMHLSQNAYATVSTSSWQTSSEMFERALRRARCRSIRGEIAGGARTTWTRTIGHSN
jgi:glycosyltransferase involved in cell wall biosynthesis